MKKLIIICFLVASIVKPAMVQGQEFSGLESGAFTTAEVTEGSFGGLEDCLEYCFIGICVWLVCSIYECHLEYTAKVAHNLPDLVVSAYSLPGDIAYGESKALYGAASKATLEAQMGLLGDFVSGGGDKMETSTQRKSGGETRQQLPDIVFKEINIVGSPIVEEVSEQARANTNGYICRSSTDPMEGFYSSEVDGIAWRFGLTELFYSETYNPLARVIGQPLVNYWGRVYPRQGSLHQRNDAKSAGVMAVRAMDFTTREDQPHIYNKPPIDESHEGLRRWQMISPSVEQECKVMGDDPEFGLSTSQKSNDYKYGFLYWGRHECCVLNAGVLIAEIEITEVCI